MQTEILFPFHQDQRINIMENFNFKFKVAKKSIHFVWFHIVVGGASAAAAASAAVVCGSCKCNFH